MQKVVMLRSPVPTRLKRILDQAVIQTLEPRRLLSGSSYMVSNTNDSGAGSLRAEILASNAAPGDTNTISFVISGSGVQTISLQSSLPAVTNPVVLDGTTQTGYSNKPLVEINFGTLTSGLTISAGGSTVRALTLDGLSAGDLIDLDTAGGNTIEGDFLGTDPTGASVGSQQAGEADGIRIAGTSSDNTIGGNTALDRNIISGNNSSGIFVAGRSTGDLIAGNYIGADVFGTSSLPNAGGGIYLQGFGDTIGGASSGARNIISGNQSFGLFISGDSISNSGTDNLVEGNYIGTDFTGSASLGNTTGGSGDGSGIVLSGASGAASGNLIGGTTAGAGNLISYNRGSGIEGVSDSINVITGNLIGLDPTGQFGDPNGQAGIDLLGSSNDTIGGTAAGAGNFISGNIGAGIELEGSQGGANGAGASGTAITDNSIGLGTGGTLSFAGISNGLSNVGDGILSSNDQNTAISGNSILFNANVNGWNVVNGPGDSLEGGTFSQTLPADLPINRSVSAPAATLTSAAFNSTTKAVTVTGTFHGQPSTTYAIQAYAGRPMPPQQAVLLVDLGPFNITTDSSGNADISTQISQTAVSSILPGDTVSVTATDNTSGDTSEFSNSTALTSPEVASQLVFAPEPANGTAGVVTPSFVVKVKDSNGAKLAGNTDIITLTVTSGPGPATTGSTLTAVAVNGQATFSDITFDKAGTYKLTASDGSLSTKSTAFTINPAAASTTFFTQMLPNVTASNAIDPPITVDLNDPFGNLVTTDNAKVKLFLAVEPSGATIGGTTVVHAVGGVAVFDNISLTQAGAYAVVASRGPLTAVESNSFTVNPAPAAKLVFAQQPTNSTTGAAITPPVTINVEDQFGNIVTTSSAKVKLSLLKSPPGGVLGGTFKVAATNGVATFSDLLLDTPGVYKLEAGHGLISDGKSKKFTVSSIG